MLLLFAMVLVQVLAAFCATFWATDIIDEKKLPVGRGDWAFSGVGVRGAAVMFESLLGPALPEPDLPRRCASVGTGSTGLGAALLVAFFVGVWLNRSWGLLWSVGVGGVLTMTGADVAPFGGVRGGCAVSIVCPLLNLLKRWVDASLAVSGFELSEGFDALSRPGLSIFLLSRESLLVEAAATVGILSGLILPVDCLFEDLDRRAFRKRPTGEGDRLAPAFRGIARPVLECRRGDEVAESRESVLSIESVTGRVEDRDRFSVDEGSGGSWVPFRCSSCTSGDEVVR